MNKKLLFAVSATTAAMFVISTLSFAAEEKKAAAAEKAPRQAVRPAFGMISGTLLKIDASDPANVKLEVRNTGDNTTHLISATPMTQVTKATDISELKAGDTVRIMSKKVDSNEVAMGIMFGKLPAPPRPRPAGAKAAAPEAVKK